MRVLHLSTAQHGGGAAIAAYRLHRFLRDRAIESELLVAKRHNQEPGIHGAESLNKRRRHRIAERLDKLPLQWRRYSPTTTYSVNWAPHSVRRDIERINPDIIHLHWVAGGFISIEEVARLGRPIVWTLHDCWPFTGGCHIIYDCKRFRDSCGQCPQLKSARAFDLSRLTWHRKHRAWRNLTISAVAPSQWIAEQARTSSLFGDQPVSVIPNGLDTSVFKPFQQREARDIWGLPQDKRLILFGAISSTRDPRKGFDLLQAALKIFLAPPTTTNCELVVFGNHDGRYCFRGSQGETIHYLGHLNDECSLRILYAAADIMMVPSREESFGQTASEALACGTPVVAFDTTGLRDIIDHKKNGYLATSFRPESLADGITWTLGELKKSPEIKQRARAKAVHAFDGVHVARAHQELYEDILSKP